MPNTHSLNLTARTHQTNPNGGTFSKNVRVRSGKTEAKELTKAKETEEAQQRNAMCGHGLNSRKNHVAVTNNDWDIYPNRDVLYTVS